MTLHPEFNEDSCCQNCAAFQPDGRRFYRKPDGELESYETMDGECHRHAPLPLRATTKRYDAHGHEEVDGGEEAQPEVLWPKIVDVYFCCEWLPKPWAKQGDA